jgi:fructoselysine-6-P-deglycase FrlB-like protein
VLLHDRQGDTLLAVTLTALEIATQPELWPAAVAAGEAHASILPAPGAEVAVIGCGTSLHIGRAWGLARAAEGIGPTSAWPASEVWSAQPDVAILISRSGTTSEVLWAARALPRPATTIGITAVRDSPLAALVDHVIVLDFADERSIVQTRWATCVLAMLRAHIGHPVRDLVTGAEEAVASELPVDPSGYSRFVFLGRGWAAGLADEAALKLREGAGAWSESYPAMEYRHGPMSVTGVPTLVWSLDQLAPDLHADISASGAAVITSAQDPMVELIYIQRAAVSLALSRGLNPDAPHHLTRSVVLT